MALAMHKYSAHMNFIDKNGIGWLTLIHERRKLSAYTIPRISYDKCKIRIPRIRIPNLAESVERLNMSI